MLALTHLPAHTNKEDATPSRIRAKHLVAHHTSSSSSIHPPTYLPTQKQRTQQRLALEKSIWRLAIPAMVALALEPAMHALDTVSPPTHPPAYTTNHKLLFSLLTHPPTHPLTHPSRSTSPIDSEQGV